MLFHHPPDRAQVDAEAAMHDHVAEPSEFAPRNLWLGGFDFSGQTLA